MSVKYSAMTAPGQARVLALLGALIAGVEPLAGCGGGGGLPGEAVLSASPASLAFGDQRAGSGSPSQPISISNTGTATMAIVGIGLSGPDAASFTVDPSRCGASLAAGTSCAVPIRFAPATPGDKRASVTLTTSAAAVLPVTLSGRGTAAQIVVSPVSVALSAPAIGQTSASRVVTVTNGGTADLDIAAVTVTGTDASMFSRTSTCVRPLPPGASCAVTISFTPTSTGARSATLTVQGDATNTGAAALTGSIDAAAATVALLKGLLASPPVVVPYSEVTTALAADTAAGATTIAVTGSKGFPAAASFIAKLADGSHTEYVLVTGGMGTSTWTAVRGYNGSATSGFAATATVTWVPLATLRSPTLNGEPITAVTATFTASVGGASAGTLTSPVPNGLYQFTFSSGEERTVSVQDGSAVSWSPALAAGQVAGAVVSIVRSPAGISSGDPVQLLSQRFDQGAPVYLTQHQRLTERGAVLIADLPADGAASMSVDSTAGYPQAGQFMVSTGYEDVLVRVADAQTLTIVARAQNGTSATALSGSAYNFYQIMEVDFLGGGGTAAYYVPGRLNSGLYYLGVAPTVGPLREYKPKQPLAMHFVLDGSYFEVLANGNVAMFVIADGVVQHPPNELVEPAYGGLYWHKFDFGSKQVRKISLIASAYPMSIAHAATDTITPWDRSGDAVLSFDGDSFGEAEGYSWQSTANGGGLGLYFEAMLDLGMTQFDYAAAVGGTGYSQAGAPNPPAFPRPRWSGAQRVAAVTGGPAPTLFICGLGHNDNAISRAQFSADTLAYWRAIRAAWPSTVLVATQYYFPAAGPVAPEAFEPNPSSTANDPAILAALQSAGGPWVYINTNQGTWQNSSGVSGAIAQTGVPLITGTGYGGAPGYSGGHSTGVGNGDLMIRDDGVHPSNLGAQYLGAKTAAAIAAGVLAL